MDRFCRRTYLKEDFPGKLLPTLIDSAGRAVFGALFFWLWEVSSQRRHAAGKREEGRPPQQPITAVMRGEKKMRID
jgi:hypothetical protein